MGSMTRFLLTLMTAFALTACGGGGGSSSTGPSYTGSTSPAAVTSSNAEDIGSTSGEASKAAVDQNATNESNPFGIVTSSTGDAETSSLVERLTRALVDSGVNAGSFPTGIVLTSDDLNASYPVSGFSFCGGSVSIPDSFGSSAYLNGTITYNNLCFQETGLGQFTVNGTVTFTETADSLAITYSNFSVTHDGETETINMTVECTYSPSYNCAISSDYYGSDGEVYRIADVSISGSGEGPYSITARFYHPDYGYVDVSASGLVYDCPDGGPSTGTITATGTAGSYVTITITGCGTFTGTWFDGSTTDTF